MICFPRRFLGGLALLFFVLIPLAGPPLGMAEDAKPKKTTSADAAYLLQPGDKVRIKIFPEDEYLKSGDVQISTEGNITLPLVGKVTIAGKTMSEAEQAITKILAADYLVNPETVVELVESSIKKEKEKRTVSVLGQVKKPGSYEFPPPPKKMSLLEVLSLAGGFSEIANAKKIKIIRQGTGEQKVIHANAEAIIGGKDKDVELEPGDVINVSESLF